MPVPCQQCENAPCVNVCPVGATYSDETGVVLIDARRCIGCRMCMAACLYQRPFFNWVTPKLPPEAALAEYSPHYPVPAVKETVIQCIFCAYFLHDGKLPYCVVGCPMKALYMGDLNEDIVTNGREIVKLSRFLREVEWSITTAAFAAFMLIFAIFAKIIPVLSVWEVAEQAKVESHSEREERSAVRNPENESLSRRILFHNLAEMIPIDGETY